MNKRLLAGIALIGALGLFTAGCSSDTDPANNTTASDSAKESNAASSSESSAPALDTIVAGTLTVCSNPPFPPFEMEDPDAPTGYSGFDIELSNAIADEIGLDFAVTEADFDALQSGMMFTANRCDMGASGITITEERKKNIDFADPYYDSLQSLLVAADSGITGIDGLAGKKVAVQVGTTGESYANEHATGAEIVSYPSDGEMWLALQGGAADAILQDQPVNYEHEQADSKYKIVETYNTDEQYGFAFGKDQRPALVAAVNEALKTLRDNGKYDELYAKYFGEK